MTNDWAGQIEPGDIWVTVGFGKKCSKNRLFWMYMTSNMPNSFIEERLQILRRQARILGVIQLFHDCSPAKLIPYRGDDSAIQNDQGERNAIALMQKVKDRVVEDLSRILGRHCIDFNRGGGKTILGAEKATAILKEMRVED